MIGASPHFCLFATGVSIFVVALGASAQTPPHLDGHRLPLRTDTLAEYLVKGNDTISTGYVIDRISLVGDRLVRVYAEQSRLTGGSLDSMEDRVADLRPILYDHRSNQMVGRINYSADSATGWMRNSAGDSIPVSLALPTLIYDGASFDLVVRASDLKEGFELTAPIFELGPNAVTSAGGRVTGSEVIAGRDCWVFKGHFNSIAVTFWIDKATRAFPRQYLQVSVNLGILFTKAHLKKRGTTAS